MIHGHGGEVYPLARKLKVSPEDIRDFSTNISHYPLPQPFWEELSQSLKSVRLLPEVDNTQLINEFSLIYNINQSNVLAGNGTTEFIYLIPRVLNPKRVIILNPTYSDYRDASILAGIKVIDYGPFIHRDDYNVFFDLYIKDLMENDLVFFCNPNNPNGHFFDKEFLLKIINKNPHVFWIIDESYAPFVDFQEKSSLISGNIPLNLIILRSFSKIYGLPGIRLGFVVAHGEIIKKLRDYLPPWNISSLTQSIALLIMKHCDYNYEESVRIFYRKEKKFFLEEIKKIGYFNYIKADTHFLLFVVKERINCLFLRDELKKRGILIRLCSNFKGLDDKYIRISLRNRLDNLLLLNEIIAIIYR